MKPRFIDAHAHLQFAAFDKDRDKVIARTLGEHVWAVNVGTQRNTSFSALKIAEAYDGMFATVGLHPIHTNSSWHDPDELGGEKGFKSRGEEFSYEYYRNLALNEKVVAIGECGLDYYRLGALPAARQDEARIQKQAFISQIELATEVGKPLMIHCRDAYDDLIDILVSRRDKLRKENPGIVHFFTGTEEQARKLLGLGFCFSFGGAITFGENYDNIIRALPLDSILLETDAPYVAPAPHRGKRNEPLYAIEVAKKISILKAVTLEEALFSTTATAMEVLMLDVR